MFSRPSAWLFAVCLLGAGSGCTYDAAFALTMKKSSYDALIAGRSRRPAEEIEIYEHGRRPDRPYTILGTLEAPTVQWSAHYTRADLIPAMQRRAAEIGADAIIDVRDQQDPTTMARIPFKNLFMWGEAVVFEGPGLPSPPPANPNPAP